MQISLHRWMGSSHLFSWGFQGTFQSVGVSLDCMCPTHKQVGTPIFHTTRYFGGLRTCTLHSTDGLAAPTYFYGVLGVFFRVLVSPLTVRVPATSGFAPPYFAPLGTLVG